MLWSLKPLGFSRQVFQEVEAAVKLMMMPGCGSASNTLRDHRSLQCNADDYERMAAVPKRKGACFR